MTQLQVGRIQFCSSFWVLEVLVNFRKNYLFQFASSLQGYQSFTSAKNSTCKVLSKRFEQKNDKGLAAAAYDESPHQHEIACNAYALLIIKVFKKVLKVLKRLKALLK